MTRFWGEYVGRLPRRGFSLLELLVATAILGILTTAIASAIALAARALPTADSPSALAVVAGRWMGEMTDDLRFAESILHHGPHAITFTVPDRTGNGLAETISYSWSGQPGDPLVRRLNGGPAVELVADVHRFQFAWQVVDRSETLHWQEQTPETLLASYSATTDLADFAVAPDNALAQYFVPNLPANTVSWEVTRVTLRMKTRGSAKGQTAIQLRPHDGTGRPASSVLAERIIFEESLPGSHAWREISFSGVTGLHPSDGLCIVATWVVDTLSCDLQYRMQGAPTSSGVMSRSSNNTTWTNQSGQALMYMVHGRALTAHSRTDHYQHLQHAEVVLQAGSGMEGRVHAAVRLVNTPQVVADE